MRAARRWRLPAAILLVVLATTALTVALTPSATPDGPLDPASTRPDGGRAVARVLAARGVEVDVARDTGGLTAALPAGEERASTIVVVQPSRLGRRTAGQLLAARDAGATVIVVDAGPGPLRALGLPDTVDPERRSDDGPVPAACDDPRLTGLSLRVDGRLAYPGPDACFDGSLLRRDGLTLLGAGRLLANDQVLRADDAAVALRLLGARPRLVWYVPDVAEQGPGDAVGLRSLLPAWLLPSLVLGLLALVALVLWRARRLGPLVREPLPVAVRAAEAVEGLGRLYQRSGDRQHAAGVLRAAARRRWRERLAVSPDADDLDLAERVATARGRGVDDVRALLLDGPVPDDRTLVALASALTDLDEAGDP
ncbi:DUF4350 domain-containing protein [Nocardioides sp. TRM66260-LWL]|uniref:DUF4350 domain-containing protein n=1 Tax=Nocardioides sp. TRM66260-LWL TaxID=2874478 RepID=UPI001CC68CAB|nr:DUF4350 domain-containing protein [Nocardioides sp. TRM66260-LWL]MBZ5734530.1 DUF4350 domain-containing protein [Nocardioides sp. TRM66260-LWL]